MKLQVNDSAGRMIQSFMANEGKEAMANLSLMWLETYKNVTDAVEKGNRDVDLEGSFGGLAIMTELIKRLNDDQ